MSRLCEICRERCDEEEPLVCTACAIKCGRVSLPRCRVKHPQDEKRCDEFTGHLWSHWWQPTIGGRRLWDRVGGDDEPKQSTLFGES